MGEYYWQLLISNSCKKHFVKLKQLGKNALDFYIAVQVGNCIGKNQNAEIAIISNDKDYTAVIDYVKQIEKTKAQHVVIASSVIEAMSILGVPREKRNQVIAKMNSMVTIDPNYKLITNIEADKDKRDTQLEKKVRRLHKQRWHRSLREILCLRKA